MKRRGVLILTSLAVAVGLLVLLTAAVLAGDADIVISEVMFDAMYEGSNQGEWVEIYNKGETAVDLTGWQIVDNNISRTITATMCPNSSCSIRARECWLIATTITNLQTEFYSYTNPLRPTVQTTRTIFLDNKIGDGLHNTTDTVILKNSSGGNVDCVSWANTTGTVCSSLTYITGSNGVDTNLENTENGQSIANIGGSWYKHVINASPYSCTNTATGGSPTAITIESLLAQPATDGLVSRLMPPLAGSAALGLAALAWARWRGLGQGKK